MAKFYLLTSLVTPDGTLPSGSPIDEELTDLTALAFAGAVLLPETTPGLVVAANRAIAAHARGSSQWTTDNQLLAEVVKNGGDGSVLNGGQVGPVIAGSTDATPVSLIANGVEEFGISASGDVTIAGVGYADSADAIPGAELKVELDHNVWSHPVGNAVDGDGFLWVSNNDSGVVQKIDPATLRIVQTIDLNASLGVTRTRGVLVAGDFVFISCLFSSLVAVLSIDTGELVGTAAIDTDFRARSCTFDDVGSLWVLGIWNSDASRTSLFRFASFFKLNTGYDSKFDLGIHVEQLTFGFGHLWAGQGDFGSHIYKIDPAAPDASVSFDVGTSVWSCCCADGSVVASGWDGNVRRFDPDTFPAVPIATIPSGIGNTYDLVGDGLTIWATGGTQVIRIDMTLGFEAVIATVTIPNSNEIYSPVVAASSLWVVNRYGGDEGSLVKVSRGLGSETFVREYLGPSKITYDAAGVIGGEIYNGGQVGPVVVGTTNNSDASFISGQNLQVTAASTVSVTAGGYSATINGSSTVTTQSSGGQTLNIGGTLTINTAQGGPNDCSLNWYTDFDLNTHNVAINCSSGSQFNMNSGVQLTANNSSFNVNVNNGNGIFFNADAQISLNSNNSGIYVSANNALLNLYGGTYWQLTTGGGGGDCQLQCGSSNLDIGAQACNQNYNGQLVVSVNSGDSFHYVNSGAFHFIGENGQCDVSASNGPLALFGNNYWTIQSNGGGGDCLINSGSSNIGINSGGGNISVNGNSGVTIAAPAGNIDVNAAAALSLECGNGTLTISNTSSSDITIASLAAFQLTGGSASLVQAGVGLTLTTLEMDLLVDAQDGSLILHSGAAGHSGAFSRITMSTGGVKLEGSPSVFIPDNDFQLYTDNSTGPSHNISIYTATSGGQSGNILLSTGSAPTPGDITVNANQGQLILSGTSVSSTSTSGTTCTVGDHYTLISGDTFSIGAAGTGTISANSLQLSAMSGVHIDTSGPGVNIESGRFIVDHSRVLATIPVALLGLATSTVTKTTTYTATTFDSLIRGDASGGAFTVTLPTAASAYDATNKIGSIITIKKVDATANVVTLKGNGAELIDGSNTDTRCSAQYNSLSVQSNGTGWDVI